MTTTKKITALDLACAVSQILLDTKCGAISGYEIHQAFMTELADRLCNHLGGQTAGMAELAGTELREWAVPISVDACDSEADNDSAWALLLPDFELQPVNEQGLKIMKVNAQQLSDLVSELLVSDNGFICSYEGFQSFMTDVADVICSQCGGETKGLADRDMKTGTWTVRIAPNDSLPDDGGIWANFDQAASLDQAITGYYSDRASGVHAAKAP